MVPFGAVRSCCDGIEADSEPACPNLSQPVVNEVQSEPGTQQLTEVLLSDGCSYRNKHGRQETGRFVLIQHDDFGILSSYARSAEIKCSTWIMVPDLISTGQP